jgi:RNA polymerase sigma-70 factor, ECF subfamily
MMPAFPANPENTSVTGDHSGVPRPSGDPSLDTETSLDLLARAKAGEAAALDALMARYLPRLRRWASGRLPRWARDMADTEDLVQEAMLQTFKRIDRFEARHDGALQAYLRQAVVNRIRDEFRRAGRAPATTPLDSQKPGLDASPLELAIGREAVDRYERALGRLRPEDRAAIVAHIEMDCTNQELAAALNKPSANAARMAVERALVRLADEMRRDSRPETA